MILRTASNFTVGPLGVTAQEYLFGDLANAPGYLPALDANYRVGGVVVKALLDHWSQYETQAP